MIPQASDAQERLLADALSADAAETDSARGGSVPATSHPPSGIASVSTAETQPTTVYLLGNLGEYELLEELAWGGMGVVYKARHKRLDRIVALKTMRRDVAEDHDLSLRFEREMRAAARLQHRNIVPIYEVGKDHDRLYYTMPYVSGGSLSKQRQRFQEPARAVAFVEKIARAVHYAHEQGILHRDLKPGNILLDEGDEPMVADFGLAKLDEADTQLTRTGQVLGTYSYMAPEQAAGRSQDTGPATDAWALGVILYELVTGRRPFVAEGRDEIRRKIFEEDPPRPSDLVPDIDPRLDTIVLTCLRKRPDERYASAGAMADDLGRYGKGQELMASTAVLPQPSRSRWFLWTTLALGSAGLLAILLATPLFDPRENKGADSRPRERTEVLIGPDGPTKQFTWIAGENHIDAQRIEPGKGWFIATSKACFLELLSNAPSHYRLDAEILHTDWQIMGGAGCYFGSQLIQQSFRHHLWFALIDFGRRTEFGASLFAVKNSGGIFGGNSGRYQDKELAGKTEKGFHSMAIEVSAAEVVLRWNGQRVDTRSRADLEKYASREFLFGDKGIQASYAPGAALGIYVVRGAAYFRNVRLTDLSD